MNKPMTQIEKLQLANTTAKRLIAGFAATVEATPDVVEARMKELKALSKDELIAHIIKMEAPKADKTVKVEDVAKALLTSPECAIFNYETIASLIQQALPDAKTSQKTVASYASKKAGEWAIVKRERFNIDPAEYLRMAMQANGGAEHVEQPEETKDETVVNQ